jgi:hypothetical protein
MKKNMDTWVAFDADSWEYETFDSMEKAKAWIIGGNSDEEIGEGAENGSCFIAKITHRSKFTETDRKENYHEHTDDCPEDCDEEEWLYDCGADYVGRIEMVPVDLEQVADHEWPTNQDT